MWSVDRKAVLTVFLTFSSMLGTGSELFFVLNTSVEWLAADKTDIKRFIPLAKLSLFS